MLHDALVLTRRFHEILVVVSLLTLLFSLSLVSTDRAVMLRDAIRPLRTADFGSYDDFTSERVAQHVQGRRRLVSAWFGDTFGPESSIEDLERLEERFTTPLHVSKFEVRGTIFADMKNMPPSELLSFGGSPNLVRDVEVVQVDFEHVSSWLGWALGPFIERNVRVPLSVLDAETADWENRSRGAQGTRLFRLPPWPDFPGRERLPSSWALPASYKAKIEYVTVPESGFMDWVERQEQFREVGPRAFRRLVSFDSPLWTLSVPQRGESFEELYQDLLNDVASAGPISQRVPIYGVAVPAVLVGMMAPVVLGMLSYFLAMHTRHLRSFAGSDSVKALKSFAWLPLTLRTELSWIALTATSVLVLPCASLWVLMRELASFEGIDLSVVSGTVYCAWMSILVFGCASMYSVRELRRASSS